MARGKKTDGGAVAALKRQLKAGQAGRLYVFYGEEAYLKEHYLNRLKQLLIPRGLEEFNLRTLAGRGCTAHDVAQAVDCLPVMSGRTMTVVTDLDLFGGGAGQREEFERLFAQLPEYCCLVFYYDTLACKPDQRTKLFQAVKAHGLPVNFSRQEEGDLTDWIVRRLRALECEISPGDAQYLIFRCGDLMHTLAGETDKLAAYAGGGRITRAHIDAAAIPQLDAVVFQMTDAVARGRFDQAAAVLGDLLAAREAPVMILAVAGRYFRQLYTARLLLERRRGAGELMELWGMRTAWQAEKVMDAARRYSLPWCRRAVVRCAQADVEMKSGGGDGGEQLVGLLMELANTGEKGR